MPTVAGAFLTAAVTGSSAFYGLKPATISRVLASDGLLSEYATAPFAGGSGATNFIEARGISTTVPLLATINSITIVARRYNSNTGTSVTDSVVKLLKGYTPVGSSNATGTQYPSALGDATYGGDLWGTTWTDSEVNGPGFGVQISSAIDDTSIAVGGLPYFDYISYSIDYTDYVAPLLDPPIDQHFRDGGTYHRANEGVDSTINRLLPSQTYQGLPTEHPGRDLVADPISETFPRDYHGRKLW